MPIGVYPRRPKSLAARFWAKVRKADGCWEWQGTRNAQGYGRMTAGARGAGYVRAHRAAYELLVGPIPEGMWVLHRCDNPPCVRPDHLFLGTRADNMADMAAKGRANTLPARTARLARRNSDRPDPDAARGNGMSKPRLLDLFCGAGGAAMGYHRAGFEVVGVDINPQPHYPFEFHQADALNFPIDGFDAIHASPPCQFYSITRNLPWVDRSKHWDSIPPTRRLLAGIATPWVMENVAGAPMDGLTLCGQMFGLRLSDGRPIYRHRLFETPFFALAPAHPKHFETIQAGHQTRGRIRASADREAIGVPWMSGAEARQAIPPAYTEWIGRQLLQAIERAA